MKSPNTIIARVCLYIFLLIQLFVSAYPIFLMILTSFKNTKDIFKDPLGFPNPIEFQNYLDIFTTSRYDLYFRNSIFVSLTSVLFILILSALGAYVIAKYKFFANNFIYIYFLVGIMIPIKLGTINIIQILNKLHLTNNLIGLIIIYTAFGIPFGIFILVAFVRGVPEEISNAARVDGCSDYGIFFRIILPMIRPGLSAVAIISLFHTWNDFWWPLILIKDDNLKTVPLAVSNLFGQYDTRWGNVFALLTTASIPFIIFYLVLSRQFIEGLSHGALKG